MNVRFRCVCCVGFGVWGINVVLIGFDSSVVWVCLKCVIRLCMNGFGYRILLNRLSGLKSVLIVC